jgi:sn-2 palmitoyl-lipid 9-desaturase
MALSVPESTTPFKVNYLYVVTIVSMHLLALLALHPYFFSWIGLAVMLIGIHVFGQGITIGYHRLLTHRSFKTVPWVEHTFAILGICCMEDSPARWVAIHRIHDVHSDERPDPHTPLVNFFWSHMGWLMVQNKETHSLSAIEKFAKDLLRDPFYMRLEKRPYLLLMIALSQLPVFFALGFVAWVGASGSDATGLEHGGLGILCSRRRGLAHNLVCELAKPYVWISELRDQRREQEQLACCAANRG